MTHMIIEMSNSVNTTIFSHPNILILNENEIEKHYPENTG